MTHREKPRASPRLPAEPPAGLVVLPLPAAAVAGDLWPQWFAHATEEQRQAALALAASQGVVYAHQLPAPTSTLSGQPEATSPADLLLQPLDRLSSFTLAGFDFFDRDLDEEQTRAVEQALSTPDGAFLLGYPGSGKSRTIAEILRQAVKTGRSVLFASATAAGVDRVLSLLARDGNAACVVRHLGAEEPTGALPACVANMCPPERVRLFREQTLPVARAAIDAARAQVATRRAEVDRWAALANCLLARTEAHERLREAERRVANVDQEVRQERTNGTADTPYRQELRKLADERDRKRKEIEAKREQLRAEAARLGEEQKVRDAERQQLAPLAEAQQGHRWWTVLKWRATFSGNVLARLEELAHASKQAADRVDAIAAEEKLLAVKLQEADKEYEDAVPRLENEEIVRRLKEVTENLGQARGAEQQVGERWKYECSRLGDNAPPKEMNAESLEAAKRIWEERVKQDEAEAEWRVRWLQTLEQVSPNLPAHFMSNARVVAGTVAGLRQPGEVARGVFDLLVVDEAHRVSDADLQVLAQRTRRWVLVGEPFAHLHLAPRRSGEARQGPTPSLLHRLFDKLHCSPQRLPARWLLNAERLTSCLRPMPTGDDVAVVREPVLDRPEIEVAIAQSGDQDPRIVEVSFPATTPLAEAKEYIYRELQELSVQATGHNLIVRETPSAIVVGLSLAAGDTTAVPLDEGVTELIAPCASVEAGWHTARLSFSREAGWDRERALRWVADKLDLRDAGRTTLLTRGHRAVPMLTRFVSDLLYGGVVHGGTGAVQPGTLPAFEFVPVITAGRERRGDNGSRFNGPGRSRPGREPNPRDQRQGGAGLECDLANPGRPDALPGDLRHALPAEGVVNLPEARTVLRVLEDLANDSAFRSASASWQQRGAGCPANGELGNSPVAVIALGRAQAELLKNLTQRSSALRNTSVQFEVGTPADFSQRECLVALVSLTRSHTHRAVPFCEHPDDLMRAMTRPAGRLLVFGDPGTMLRRTQWNGALDHQDEVAGPMEQALLVQLLAQIPETDVHPQPIRSRESSGV